MYSQAEMQAYKCYKKSEKANRPQLETITNRGMLT